MRYWASTPHAVASDALDGDDLAIRLIRTIGSAAFPSATLAALSRSIPTSYVTAYGQAIGADVKMRFAGAFGRPDVTQRCWRIYREGPWRRDASFAEAAHRAVPGSIGWCHLVAGEIDDERHRVDVYQRHGLSDRLSLVDADADGAWFALNLFRTGDERHFDDRDFARLEVVAPILVALARRHVALLPSTDPSAREERLAAASARLGAHPAGLTTRERDVCARLAVGMTYDGISADLGIAVTSAKTYRNRAFERLGLRFRSELAALCFGSGSPD